MTLISAPRAVGTNLSTLVTVWRQGKSKIKHLLSNASPETRTAHESTCTARESTCRVPYEIVEMIIAHTAHNLNTLKACSLTCRSWHTAAAPLLNYAFAFRWRGPVVITKPESLPKLHKQGLLDLFTTIRVDSFDGEFARFTPQAFSHRGLYHFSAFTKVHTLELRHVAIGLFVPGAELYFGHLSPTLRSITLIDSHCHPPQLSHFLSLFPNLDDVEIRNTSRWVAGTTAPDTELVPLSAPKLRGRLILHGFDLAETWTDLIALCGGLRFHYMDLLKSAKCAPILLEACAGTLETLRLHTRDVPPGKQFCTLPHWFHYGFELTEDISRFRPFRSIGAQSPPVSTNRGLVGSFLASKPPEYHHQGGLLDDHIPRVLRARCRPCGQCYDVFTRGSHAVRDIAQYEPGAALQVGFFVRGSAFRP